jgi:hypothetical protein
MLDFGGLGHHRLLRRKTRLGSNNNAGGAAAKNIKSGTLKMTATRSIVHRNKNAK